MSSFTTPASASGLAQIPHMPQFQLGPNLVQTLCLVCCLSDLCREGRTSGMARSFCQRTIPSWARGACGNFAQNFGSHFTPAGERERAERAFVLCALFQFQPFECWPRRVPFSQQNTILWSWLSRQLTRSDRTEGQFAIARRSRHSRPLPSLSSFLHLINASILFCARIE